MLTPAKVQFDSLGFTPGMPSLSEYPCNPFSVRGPGACPGTRAVPLSGLGAMDLSSWAILGLGAVAVLAFSQFQWGRARKKRLGKLRLVRRVQGRASRQKR